MSQRWIIHVDLDAFYAAVEVLQDASLRGKPVIVGGDPEGRGVVSSASYEARSHGVHSAMPSIRAKRLCPHAVFLHPRHQLYKQYSNQVMDILQEYTPLVEPISIDEAFLDVTGCEARWGPTPELAEEIQQRIRDEVELDASLGVASNKLVAKIASDYGKPAGLVVVRPGEEATFLAPLPVEELWGVGEVTGRRLRSLGVKTIGDLAELSSEYLERQFGSHGRSLYRHARGIDEREVVTEREPKSLSHEHTFARDTNDPEMINRKLLDLSGGVARRLRKHGVQARTVTLKLRRSDFSTVTRSHTLQFPTDLAAVLYETAAALFEEEWREGELVRLVGVRASHLAEQVAYQLHLFEESDLRRGRLSRTVDEIRRRFGRDAVIRASFLEKENDPEG